VRTSLLLIFVLRFQDFPQIEMRCSNSPQGFYASDGSAIQRLQKSRWNFSLSLPASSEGIVSDFPSLELHGQQLASTQEMAKSAMAQSTAIAESSPCT
jgi:hypothetical protein